MEASDRLASCEAGAHLARIVVGGAHHVLIEIVGCHHIVLLLPVRNDTLPRADLARLFGGVRIVLRLGRDFTRLSVVFLLLDPHLIADEVVVGDDGGRVILLLGRLLWLLLD